jgi:hypothetical protein
MRQPSTPAQRWHWWEEAVAGHEPPIHDNDPHAGYFAVRKFRYGEWVKGPLIPARIWWEPGEIDPETGELLSDERLRGEVDGKPIDPWRTWTWLSRRPITEREWLWLKALSPLLPTKIPPKRA